MRACAFYLLAPCTRYMLGLLWLPNNKLAIANGPRIGGGSRNLHETVYRSAVA